MSRIFAAITSIALTIAVTSCVPIPIEAEPKLGPPSFKATPPLAPGEAVTVLWEIGPYGYGLPPPKTEAIPDEEIVTCMSQQLLSVQPALNIIPPTEFPYRSTFSWRVTSPPSGTDRDFAALLRKKVILEKLNELNLRHMILVHGLTKGKLPSERTGQYAPLWLERVEKETTVMATILDVKNVRVLGTETAIASATGTFIAVGVIFEPQPMTQKAACRKLARRIAEVIGINKGE